MILLLGTSLSAPTSNSATEEQETGGNYVPLTFPLRFRFTLLLPHRPFSYFLLLLSFFLQSRFNISSGDSRKGDLVRVEKGCDQLWEDGKEESLFSFLSPSFSQAQLFTFESPAGFQKLRFLNMRNADGSSVTILQVGD